MNRYDNRLRVLMEEYETLISRENEKILPGNGIFERYKYPILTAATLHWNGDTTSTPKRIRISWNASVLMPYSMQEQSSSMGNIL